MTNFQTGIITIMSCAITGERSQLPDGFSIEEAESFAVKQNIVTLIYDGAVKCGVLAKVASGKRHHLLRKQGGQ